MIAVDWGTTNFRAFRLDAAGGILDKCSCRQGILGLAEGDFEIVLRAQAGAWLAQGEQHILMCGMVGSRQGWVEAPYLGCPAGLSELAGAVIAVPFVGAEVRLVPGVRGVDAAGVPEVMRGEETAAMGIVASRARAAVACFPGTHSKWVQLAQEKIVSFSTFMTGELFSALRSSTILQRMMTANPTADRAAFEQGVARSADQEGLLHHLFGVRTLALMGRLSPDAGPSYLSGLLIGHEVRAAMLPGSVVHLVGSAELCGLYAQAIEACGGSATVEDEDAAALGLAAIGGRLQWT